MARMIKMAAAAIALALTATACGGGGSDTSGTTAPDSSPSGSTIAAEVASYDLAAHDKERFIVGLFTANNLFVDYGTVGLSFSFLGTKQGGSPQPMFKSTGHFVPVDAAAKNAPTEAVALPASKGRGVYGTDVTFDKPGYWQVEVDVNL